MQAHLVVLTGSHAGAELELPGQKRYLLAVVRDGAVTGITLTDQASADNRVAEIQRRGDVLHVRGMAPSGAITINGKRSLDKDQLLVLGSGDVIVIHGLAVRVAIAPAGSFDVEGSSIRDDSQVASELVGTANATESGEISGVMSQEDDDKLKSHIKCLQRIANASLLAANPTSLLAQVLEQLGDGFPASLGSVLWRAGDGDQFRLVARLGGRDDEVRFSRTVLRHVLETGEAVLSHDTAEDKRLAKSRSVVIKGMKSVLCVPILSGKRVAGVLHLDTPGLRRFDLSDMAMVTAVAKNVSAALKAMEQRTSDLAAQVGRGVRETLQGAARLATPGGDTLEAGPLRVAATRLGDAASTGLFSEAVTLRDAGGNVALVVGAGEVVGKSPQNAVGAVKAHATIRGLAPYGLPPATIVREVGRVVASTGLAEDGSVVVGRFDPGSGRLDLAGAGLVVVIHHIGATAESSAVAIVGPGGEPIANAPSLQLAPGDTVLLGSAGLVSAEAAETELATIGNWIRAQAKKDPAALLDALNAQRALVGGRPASVIAIRRI